MKIRNKHNEKLDVLIEGKEDADITLVLAHGFGTNKNEGDLFIDISNDLKDALRIVRFDFSGYGKSEGKQEEVDYKKHTDDLEAILEYVKNEYKGKIYLLAHSMGTFVTSLLSPDGIEKTIFTGIPNADTKYIINLFTERLKRKQGAVLNIKGVSMYPRTSGEMQKVGSSFWKVLKELDPIKAITDFSKKTKLLIIHPLQDDVIGNVHIEEYSKIPTAKYITINGNHAFTKPEDREILLKRIRRHFWILPNIIKEVGFNFRWDEKKVWELDLPVEEISIKKLEWHFDIPFWFNENGFYDQKPRDVINNPNKYPKRYKRIMDTDLTYPLDIMWNKGHWVLLDGLHRLAKHSIEGHKTVKVRKILEKDKAFQFCIKRD